MKWLEVLEIRTIYKKSKLFELELRNVIKKMENESKIRAIKTFYKSAVETDFCIQLLHHSEVDNRGSPLGVRLASAFKDFGLVKHSVWCEIVEIQKS